MAKSKWIVDTMHSSVDFSIRHMMIASVKGAFHSFSAEVEADAQDLTTGEIDFSIDVASIDTRNADRDNHLKSADFFDAENHPKITFRSTNIQKKADGQYSVTGDMTIRGITRSETFDVTFEGEGTDPYGNEKAGFSVEGSVKRSDFGLTYNAALETGGVLIGDQVKFSVSIEAAKAK
ncbi:MAG: YceI family protein [Firmicutes bacterium]|nr:YceI family protein [Bacillota bacterium]